MKFKSNNYLSEFFVDKQKRDLVLILPGGGYQRTSPRESLPVAKMFNQWNYHSVVYHYRETMLVYPEIFDEGKSVIDYLTNHPLVNQLLLIGFSAGGHFAGYLLTKYSTCFKAGILCYPVISADPIIRHDDSFKNLLNNNLSADLLEKVSIEKQVTQTVPPIFLWHTFEDGSVPIENSLVLISSLRKHQVKVEAHLFNQGRHGLSLINQETSFDDMLVADYLLQNKTVSIWTTLLQNWLTNLEEKND